MTTTKQAFSASTIHAKRLLWFYATMWTWGFQEGGIFETFFKGILQAATLYSIPCFLSYTSKQTVWRLDPANLFFSYGGENHYHFLSLFHTQRDPRLMIRHMLVVGGCGRGWQVMYEQTADGFYAYTDSSHIREIKSAYTPELFAMHDMTKWALTLATKALLYS